MLKSLNFSELDRFSKRLDSWVGAQFQDVTGTATEVGLRLHSKGDDLFLWFDLDAKTPLVLWFENRFPPHRKNTKPIHLFLKANLIGLHLESVIVDSDAGRVLRLELTDGASVEARLFPHGRNFSVSVAGKSLSWSKQKELKSASSEAPKEFQMREWAEVEKFWLENKRPANSSSTQSDIESFVKKLKKDLKKKERALEKLEEKIAEESAEKFLEVGNWLQSFGVQDFPGNVPVEFESRVDKAESLAANIQSAFQKYEKAKGKIEGRTQQLKQLQVEIASLHKQIESPKLPKATTAKKQENLLKVAGAKGRTRVFEGFDAVIGKSAADNLALLRRAKPWYLWMHLKDQPGAYVILRRNKKQELKNSDFQAVFEWLLRETVPSAEQSGVHEVLLTECRYVRPIKGDKMGRVTHQSAQVLSYSLKG